MHFNAFRTTSIYEQVIFFSNAFFIIKTSTNTICLSESILCRKWSFIWYPDQVFPSKSNGFLVISKFPWTNPPRTWSWALPVHYRRERAVTWPDNMTHGLWATGHDRTVHGHSRPTRIVLSCSKCDSFCDFSSQTSPNYLESFWESKSTENPRDLITYSSFMAAELDKNFEEFWQRLRCDDLTLTSL